MALQMQPPSQSLKKEPEYIRSLRDQFSNRFIQCGILVTMVTSRSRSAFNIVPPASSPMAARQKPKQTKNKNPKRGYLRYSGRHLPTAAGKTDCETSRLAFVFLPCECNNPVDGSLPAIAAHCFNFKNFNKLASAKRSNAVLLHLQQYHGKRYNKQPKPRHSPLLTQGNRKTHFSSNVLSIGAR